MPALKLFQINHYSDNRTLFSGRFFSMRECLSKAIVKGVDLSGANLAYLDLDSADLRRAKLRWARFGFSSLRNACLRGADLEGATFFTANLHGADLCYANLRLARMAEANLTGARLEEADLTGVNMTPYVIVPEGKLIGWKKLVGGNVAKLEIPEKAKRVNAYGSRKCRAEYVRTIEIYDISGSPRPKNFEGKSSHDHFTRYRAGRITRPDKYNPDPRVECSHGIHFFLTREEAENYF